MSIHVSGYHIAFQRGGAIVFSLHLLTGTKNKSRRLRGTTIIANNIHNYPIPTLISLNSYFFRSKSLSFYLIVNNGGWSHY